MTTDKPARSGDWPPASPSLPNPARSARAFRALFLRPGQSSVCATPALRSATRNLGHIVPAAWRRRASFAHTERLNPSPLSGGGKSCCGLRGENSAGPPPLGDDSVIAQSPPVNNTAPGTSPRQCACACGSSNEIPSQSPLAIATDTKLRSSDPNPTRCRRYSMPVWIPSPRRSAAERIAPSRSARGRRPTGSSHASTNATRSARIKLIDMYSISTKPMARRAAGASCDVFVACLTIATAEAPSPSVCATLPGCAEPDGRTTPMTPAASSAAGSSQIYRPSSGVSESAGRRH